MPLTRPFNRTGRFFFFISEHWKPPSNGIDTEREVVLNVRGQPIISENISNLCIRD